MQLKILRSSTFFIRGDANKVIGLLCINHDITELLRMKDKNISIDDFVKEIIQTVILESGIKQTERSLEEKRELIRRMEEKGVFKFKGAVSIVSKRLDVSTQTIYRYLKENEKAK